MQVRRTCRSSPGQAMSSAMPPKWASIWSARMIEIAIVISAWRSSWPCFQRRKTCCMISPAPAMIAVATISGHDPVARVDLLAREAEGAALPDLGPLELERDVAAEQEERAVGHVDDAHQPEDEREAARDDEVEPGDGHPVQHRDQEVLRIVDGGAERRRALARRRGEEEHPEEGEQGEQGDQGPDEAASSRPLSASRARGAAAGAAPNLPGPRPSAGRPLGGPGLRVRASPRPCAAGPAMTRRRGCDGRDRGLDELHGTHRP